MPQLQPLNALYFDAQAASGLTAPASQDLTRLIAPPYDVLDEAGKAQLQALSQYNVVTIDLPHLPPKTVGPDAVYQQAGQTYRDWQTRGVLKKRPKPTIWVYQQTYTARGREFKRRGLIASLGIQPFGKSPDGKGGIHPHEQTFSAPKEDRLKLMRATQAQLSPIFGLFSDANGAVGDVLTRRISAGSPDMVARTAHDNVLHECWAIEDQALQRTLAEFFAHADVFIADGHHRYTTALNYMEELEAKASLPPQHPARFCLFVLVSIQDPGMIVLPTHRVLGGMGKFSLPAFEKAAEGLLKIKSFTGDLPALENALPSAGPHAIGLCTMENGKATFAIATTIAPDPLAGQFPTRSPAWRQLDVAIVQHLYVERICQSQLCHPAEQVVWKFPSSLDDFRRECSKPSAQLGLLLQPTPLKAVEAISAAGELMPQKSTFFYPKLATGLAINPVS